MRTAIERGLDVVPVFAGLPECILKLMLHIKEEYANGSCQRHHGKLQGQERQRADDETHGNAINQQCRVGPMNALPFQATDFGDDKRQALVNDEVIKRSHAEQHKWIAIKAILQSPSPRSFSVFVHGHRPDFTSLAASIQVAGCRVMSCVFPSPGMVRREGDDTEEGTDPIVHILVSEERTMAAIMLNDDMTSLLLIKVYEKKECVQG